MRTSVFNNLNCVALINPWITTKSRSFRNAIGPSVVEKMKNMWAAPRIESEGSKLWCGIRDKNLLHLLFVVNSHCRTRDAKQTEVDEANARKESVNREIMEISYFQTGNGAQVDEKQ